MGLRSSTEDWELGAGEGVTSGDDEETGRTLIWVPRSPPGVLPTSERADCEPRGMRDRLGDGFEKCGEALRGNGGTPGGADIVAPPDHNSRGPSRTGLPVTVVSRDFPTHRKELAPTASL